MLAMRQRMCTVGRPVTVPTSIPAPHPTKVLRSDLNKGDGSKWWWWTGEKSLGSQEILVAGPVPLHDGRLRRPEADRGLDNRLDPLRGASGGSK